ncbi:phosphomannomutase [Vibrio hannami]|uniref:phosphomannomutase n=1 Tax=Vibrio hannami TaxID=2717094 RepID=UPI003EB777A7
MSVITNNTADVIKASNIAFGTSGARGLVVDFTPEVCAAFSHAFIALMKSGFKFESIALAIDNRPSSYSMAMACAKAAEQAGVRVQYYGVIPTPALAYYAMQKNIPSIMVTGSHIPFDRNGLKFYRPDGEITKQDERSILTADIAFEPVTELPKLEAREDAAQAYIQRNTEIVNNNALSGKRIGIYEHSSAGRDLYANIFSALGAEVISLERTDLFVPIDTEAVGEADKEKARNWSREYNLDAIFSTDGDGDRPLVADENGEWLRGDILGLLCSDILRVEALAVPVSCNTAIELSEKFKHVSRTKIGSPYVIAEFSALNKDYKKVAGFEANGGYLTGSDIDFEGKTIKALPTRDAVLPAILLFANTDSIAGIVEQLPERYTASDRIKEFETERSKKIIEFGKRNPQDLVDSLGVSSLSVVDVNDLDGLRMTMQNGDIIHLRPSGNAPELRCYAEASSQQLTEKYVAGTLSSVTRL